jgi:hypothetical protein
MWGKRQANRPLALTVFEVTYAMPVIPAEPGIRLQALDSSQGDFASFEPF